MTKLTTEFCQFIDGALAGVVATHTKELRRQVEELTKECDELRAKLATAEGNEISGLVYGPIRPWRGGECPVDGDQDVIVLLGNLIVIAEPVPAHMLQWGEGKGIANIIAYQTVDKRGE